MKLQDSVFSSIKTANLPSSIVSYLSTTCDEFEEVPVRGGLLEDIRYAWLASEDKFVVVNLKTCQKIAAWDFGIDLKEYNSKITSVCELPTHLTPTSKQLLIGLDCDIIGGMVCLFHCDGSRILRAIQTDCKVTSLTALDDLPAGALSCFDGVALVGTQDGALLAFDLNRQSCFEAISHVIYGNEHLIKNELNIARLAVLSLGDISVIEEQRAIACNRDDHIAVQVNEGCFHGKLFSLYNPDNTVGFRASREEVFISRMLYVPQLASLIVGFNFGAFQIWNLLTMELEFTSQVSVEQLPITHFAFQEPSDDPCAFCYLWVVYSVMDKLDDYGFPIATMYSLRYQGKKVINNTLCLYQDFSNCTLRFQIELTYPRTLDTPMNVPIGGRCIACHSIAKIINNKIDDTDDTIINVCQISWECWQENQQPPVLSYMVLFDMDQWYKEHMPYSAEVETNSFISFVDLSQCVTNNARSHLCDVKVDIPSLSQYSSVQKLEEHFYPNSYAYDCTCLVSTESVWLSTLGVQRQLLSTLNSLGPSILLNPSRIYKQCVDVGLSPLYFEIPSGNASLSTQRALVLSVALSSRLWGFLLRCARESPVVTPLPEDDALSSTPSGALLPPLAEWAWGRAWALRTSAHSLASPLWVPTKSGPTNDTRALKSGPDRNSLSLLRECTAQLATLDSLFGAILENTVDRVGPEMVYNMTQRKNAVHMVSLYFRVVQWFVDVGLLPEYHLDEESILDLLDDNVQRLPYPVENLIRSYQNRRCQLFRLQGESSEIVEMPSKSCPLLFIDQFIDIECAGDKLNSIWKEDSSMTGGLYPPPTLHSLLKVYLQPDILEDNKHSLVLYTLEDYAMIFGNRYPDAIRRLMQFPTMMEMSNTNIKITQAFWHLDHRCFDFALEQLWGLCISNGSTERWSWVQNAVVASLTAQRRAQAALQWLAGVGHNKSRQAADSAVMDVDSSVGEELNSKHYNNSVGRLYLARRLPEAALGVLRYSNPKNRDYLCFFDECKKMGLLSKISKIPLTNLEEDLFIRYLQSSQDANTKDILIMFYLQRARYAEALTIKFANKEPNAEIWPLLVQMYCSGVPTLRTLTTVRVQSVDASTVPIKFTDPMPMSVFVEPKTPKPVTYKSSLIKSAITRASETWSERPPISRGLKRTLEAEDTPFICTPKVRRVGRSLLDDQTDISSNNLAIGDEATPPKQAKYVEEGLTPKMPGHDPEYSNVTLKTDLEKMLHSPAVERDIRSTSVRPYTPESMNMRDATPQSILKVRKLLDRKSPSDPRYYAETDEELETASQNTQQSDAMSRSIRFTIPYGDKSRESSPASLCEVSFTDDLKTPSLSLMSQIESAMNVNIPRKKILLASEQEFAYEIKKSSESVSAHSSVASQNDEVFYSPNESIADVLSEIYPTSDKSSHIDTHHDDDSKSSKGTSEDMQFDINLESCHSDILQRRMEADMSTLLDQSNVPGEVEVSDNNVSFLQSISESSIKSSEIVIFPLKSVLSLDSVTSNFENIANLKPQPRRSIKSRTPEVNKVPLRRSARTQSKTPEPHPAVDPIDLKSKTPPTKSVKPRKSLSRQVLEANTFIRKESITAQASTAVSEVSESKESSKIITDSISGSSSDFRSVPESVEESSILNSERFPVNVNTTPIAKLNLSEFNESILSSVASDSPQSSPDNNSPMSSSVPTSIASASNSPLGLSFSAFDKLIKRINLPDLNQSILRSTESVSTPHNISDKFPETPPTNANDNTGSTPVTKLSMVGYNDSILSDNISPYNIGVCNIKEPPSKTAVTIESDNTLKNAPIGKNEYSASTPIAKLSIMESNDSILSDSSSPVKVVICNTEQPSSSTGGTKNDKTNTVQGNQGIMNESILTRKCTFNSNNSSLKMETDVGSETPGKVPSIVETLQETKDKGSEVENLEAKYQEAISMDVVGREVSELGDCTYSKEAEISITGEEVVNIEVLQPQEKSSVIDCGMDYMEVANISDDETEEQEGEENSNDEEDEQESDESQDEQGSKDSENEQESEESSEDEECEFEEEEEGISTSESDSDVELNICTETVVTTYTTNDKIGRKEQREEVIILDSSSGSETPLTIDERSVEITVSNDCITMKDVNATEKLDSEAPSVITLTSSMSEDVEMLKKDSTDPFLDSASQESDTVTSTKVENNVPSDTPNLLEFPTDFTNYSILTDDESYVEDNANIKLQFDDDSVRSKETVDSPVKVVITDTEGRSTIEIENNEGNHISQTATENTGQKSDAPLENTLSNTDDVEEIKDNESTKVKCIAESENVLTGNDERITEENVKGETAARSQKDSTASEKLQSKRSSRRINKDTDTATSEASISDVLVELSGTESPGSKTERIHLNINPDDSAIEASDKSIMLSTRSENNDESMLQFSLRKSRRSILSIKPDLSIIPEDGSSKLDITDTADSSKLEEYSTSRRLTRHQRTLIEKSISSPPRRIMTRRSSATSVASIAGSAMSESVDDYRSESSIAHVESIDPILLMDIKEGGRTSRAASEPAIKPLRRNTRRASADIVSPARVTRRSSVNVANLTSDLVLTPELQTSFEMGSPSTPLSSGRPRRQSFTKAVEALHHTRKTRRPSTSSKPDELDLTNTSVSSTQSKVKPASQDLHGTSILEPVLEDEELPSSSRRRLRRTASEISSSSIDSIEMASTAGETRRSRAGSASRR